MPLFFPFGQRLVIVSVEQSLQVFGGAVEVVHRADQRLLAAIRHGFQYVGEHGGGVDSVVGCECDGVQVVGGRCGILFGVDGFVFESGWGGGLFLRLEAVEFEPVVEQFFSFLSSDVVGTVLNEGVVDEFWWSRRSLSSFLFLSVLWIVVLFSVEKEVVIRQSSNHGSLSTVRRMM